MTHAFAIFRSAEIAKMALFGFFRSQNKLPIIVQEAAAAMKPQVGLARKFYSSRSAFEAQLASEATSAFLHGFVLLFAAKHGVKKPELLWAATIQSFDQVFGSQLSGLIISALQRTLSDGSAKRWIDEGAGAAREFDKSQLNLLTAFLEGAAS